MARQQPNLDPVDRDFFSLVAQTAFCNPFSPRRAELEASLAGHPIEPFSERHLEELVAPVSGRLRKYEAQGMSELSLFRPEDQELMQVVFLFELYHRYCGDFDRLILEQVRLGDRSAPVPFAGEALAGMRRRGIASTETVRFFAIFFQLRRAFHFIVKGLKGNSPSMADLRSHLWQNVFTGEVRLYERYLWNRMEDFSTLLLGETGTGKGTAAAAIGRSGFIPFAERESRFAESFMRGFISLNLSQFPETLIESELFGHRKGAFTGAVEAHEGVLSRCSEHGAIFLDEIGDVPVPVQIKLLQVLQERVFCPVGSHESARFRGRVIAATNRPLARLREEKLFRDDFFYRLCSDIIHVPPLRQRLQETPGELRLLLEHALSVMLGASGTALVDQVEIAISKSVGKDYTWPGNVRELEQAVRRTLLTGSYSGQPPKAAADARQQFLARIEAETLDADALLAGYCDLIYESTRSYEAVARRTNLDRRTVKKYLGKP
jgi:DNA-binding NtrC family response regulator